MYLARELTDATLPAIGRAFGNRNHTTVLHACQRTAERIADDRDAYDAVRRLDRDARRTLMRSGPPDRLRQFIHSPCTAASAPQRQRGLCTPLNSPDDH